MSTQICCLHELHEASGNFRLHLNCTMYICAAMFTTVQHLIKRNAGFLQLRILISMQEVLSNRLNTMQVYQSSLVGETDNMAMAMFITGNVHSGCVRKPVFVGSDLGLPVYRKEVDVVSVASHLHVLGKDENAERICKFLSEVGLGAFCEQLRDLQLGDLPIWHMQRSGCCKLALTFVLCRRASCTSFAKKAKHDTSRLSIWDNIRPCQLKFKISSCLPPCGLPSI